MSKFIDSLKQSLTDLKYVRANNPAGVTLSQLPEEEKQKYNKQAAKASLLGIAGGLAWPVNKAAVANMLATGAEESWGGWLIGGELGAPFAGLGAYWGKKDSRKHTSGPEQKQQGGTLNYLNFFK